MGEDDSKTSSMSRDKPPDKHSRSGEDLDPQKSKSRPGSSKLSSKGSSFSKSSNKSQAGSQDDLDDGSLGGSKEQGESNSGDPGLEKNIEML